MPWWNRSHTEVQWRTSTEALKYAMYYATEIWRTPWISAAYLVSRSRFYCVLGGSWCNWQAHILCNADLESALVKIIATFERCKLRRIFVHFFMRFPTHNIRWNMHEIYITWTWLISAPRLHIAAFNIQKTNYQLSSAAKSHTPL